MARYRDSVCRLCRAERVKLFLKGSKCLSEKCPVERRSYPPGEHGRMRRRILGYGIQLREKQKMKRYYGMSERQFHLFFRRAEKKRGITGESLLTMLERRLENVVFIAGFSHSRSHARQLITHGHIRINGHKADIPSMLVDKGDVVSYREKTANLKEVEALMEYNKNKAVPKWIEVDREKMEAKVLSFPAREDVTLPVEEHLIVELYSK
ncbi:MAG: 30S ribosomal protein S4 [Candidatus Aminicenantes bacterium]